MPRALLLAALGVVCVACDPGYFVRSEGTVPVRPDEQMVLDAIRADELVEAAWVENGNLHARLSVPWDPDQAKGSSAINVDVERKEKFQLEVEFEVLWIGLKPSAEERERWQIILDGLRDRVLARCRE